MNLTIDPKPLATALQAAQRVVESRTSMPILSNVLLEAGDGSLTITATDLEAILRQTLEAQIDAPGMATVQARKLHEIAKGLAGDTITLAGKENGQLSITGGRAAFDLLTLAAGDFPALPEAGGVRFTLPAGLLPEMLGLVGFSTAPDATRFNLNGALFQNVLQDGKPAGLRLVTTDGHRLGLVERLLEGIPALPGKDLIIPRKALGLLQKLDGDLALAVTPEYLTAETGNTRLTVRLLDGQFPDYMAVVPAGARIKTRVRAGRPAILGTLRRVAVVADANHSARLEMREGQVIITCRNNDTGEARETAEVDIHGPGLAIGVNAAYLAEVCEAMRSEAVTLAFGGDIDPFMVTGEADEGFRHIIMPMRL